MDDDSWRPSRFPASLPVGLSSGGATTDWPAGRSHSGRFTKLDLFHFVALTCASHRRLAAENLFLRKQLAFYIERKVRPRRLNDAPESHSSCSRGLSTGDNSSPSCDRTRSCDGAGRDSACSGVGNHGALVAPGFLRPSRT